jgi:hypothetical protein
MNANQMPQIAPDLIWRFLDDNAVVVSPRLGEVRVLNGVGTIIWQLIAAHNSTEEIERYLVTHYDVSPEQASNDLQIFLTNLTERGLLVWET